MSWVGTQWPMCIKLSDNPSVLMTLQQWHPHLKRKTSQSGVCGTVLTQMGQKIPAVTVLVTNSSVNHWVCGLQFTSRPDWLSPLPRRSCDIPPMPAGHSSLHFPPQRPEVPLDHDFNTFFFLLYKCPCLTSSSFSAHMYKSAHLLPCLVGVLFKTRAWGQSEVSAHIVLYVGRLECETVLWNSGIMRDEVRVLLEAWCQCIIDTIQGVLEGLLCGWQVAEFAHPCSECTSKWQKITEPYGPWRVFHGAVMVLNGVFCNIKRTKWYRMVWKMNLRVIFLTKQALVTHSTQPVLCERCAASSCRS